MQRVTLVDANIVLRVLTQDVQHPKYILCVTTLKQSSVVPVYVMSEIVYGFLSHIKRCNALEVAKSLGELDLFHKDMRAYTQSKGAIPGWRKTAYTIMELQLESLLSTYPLLEIEQRDLIVRAFKFAKLHGFDWVDSMLLAENDLYGKKIASVDKDISAGLKHNDKASSDLQKMKLL